MLLQKLYLALDQIVNGSLIYGAFGLVWLLGKIGYERVSAVVALKAGVRRCES